MSGSAASASPVWRARPGTTHPARALYHDVSMGLGPAEPAFEGVTTAFEGVTTAFEGVTRIQDLPTFILSEEQVKTSGLGDDNSSCIICLSEYVAGDKVRF
jgi:hypothetical protein